MSQSTLMMMDLDSEVMGQTVPLAVVLPPDFNPDGDPLPLFIELHGGGGDRTWLQDMKPTIDDMFADGTLCPAVLVSFSSGPLSWYAGNWPKFIVDELPAFMAKTFNARTDRDGLVMTGGSMGGYGTLKIGLTHPERFAGIAAMEPAIEPSFERMPDHLRNTWYRMPEAEALAWGSPFDEQQWLADNPANIARANAQAIRNSGLAIHLEVGDQDFINFHDGTEFLHRVLWDHQIRHEYHLVRWADHVGASTARRFREVHAFLVAALAGGLAEPIDLPLTDLEQAYVQWANEGIVTGAPPPDYNMNENPERGPAVHAALWKLRRDTVIDDPELARDYASLPPSS